MEASRGTRCRRGRDSFPGHRLHDGSGNGFRWTRMRHFCFLACAIRILAVGMGPCTLGAPLIFGPRPTQHLTPGLAAAIAKAIDIPPVTNAANLDRATTSGT